MASMIFRIDDVSSNTDMVELKKMIYFLKDTFDAEVILGVTVFSRYSPDGAVYPGAPFKDKDNTFFYDVTQCRTDTLDSLGVVASHGLFHSDHSKLQYDAQEMSIVGSCKFLGCNIFIPPFNRYNQTTESVCRINGINLVKLDEGWKSLEYNDFDANHTMWYFHPWRFTAESLKEKLCPQKQ